MKRILLLLASILAVLFFSGTALAGETMTKKGTRGMTGTDAYTEDQLTGLNVIDRQGDHIGFIRDVKLHPETGEIIYVTVATSLVGIGEAEHAVPLEALNIRLDDKKATLTVSEGKLQSAPIIVEGESEDVFRGELYEHYGIAPAFGEGMGEPEKMMKEEKKGYKQKSRY